MGVKLGKVYRDKVHGISGVAVSNTQYLTGCNRVMLEVFNDGTITEYSFDVTRLEGVELTPEEDKSGGFGTISLKPGVPR